MIKVRRFSKTDLLNIDIQSEQKHELNFGSFFPESTFTIIDENSEVMAVVGHIEYYAGRAAAFAYVSQKAGKNIVAIVRLLRRMIETGMRKYRYERLEMSVLSGFGPGERMAKMLGFAFEGVMKKYFKGKDYKLFAKVEGE